MDSPVPGTCVFTAHTYLHTYIPLRATAFCRVLLLGTTETPVQSTQHKPNKRARLPPIALPCPDLTCVPERPTPRKHSATLSRQSQLLRARYQQICRRHFQQRIHKHRATLHIYRQNGLRRTRYVPTLPFPLQAHVKERERASEQAGQLRSVVSRFMPADHSTSTSNPLSQIHRLRPKLPTPTPTHTQHTCLPAH